MGVFNIKGLDKLFYGTIPLDSQILLSGTVGTGKTIFGLQFAYFSKEPCLIATFEEHTFELRNQAKSLGWNIEKKEEEKKIIIKRYDPFIIDDVLGIMDNEIKKYGIKRVVIHTISNIMTYLKDRADIRRTMVKIYDMLKLNKCLSILVCESPPGGTKISLSGIEEFVVDGIIRLRKVIIGNSIKNVLNIWKMRGVQHSNSFHLYEITKKGFVVYPNKKIDLSKCVAFT